MTDVAGPGPDVSVVMPTYNSAGYVRAAVQSCLAQTLDCWELIVVDDGSSDDTVSIVETMQDPRILVVAQGENRGPGAARNVGLAHCRGRWVTFLDSDDTFDPRRLEVLRSASLELGDSTVVFDRLVRTAEQPEQNLSAGISEWGSVTDLILFHDIDGFVRRYIPMQPFVSTRLIVESHAMFPEEGRIGEDLAFVVQLLSAHGARLAEVRLPLYWHRRRQDSLSKMSADDALQNYRPTLEFLWHVPAVRNRFGHIIAEKQDRMYASYAANAALERLTSGRLIDAYRLLSNHPDARPMFRRRFRAAAAFRWRKLRGQDT